MKKITINFGLSLLTMFALMTSCTKDEINDNDNAVLTSNNESLKTTGGSCSANVDFGNLVVETSWISGDKGDRDTFGACGVDGESWMDKKSNGNFALKSLAPDGHRTELKEDVGDEANLSVYKRMRFTAKYNNLPSHGVTIAQIHNRSNNIKRPWLRLYIDADGKFKIKETETNPTGSSSNYTTYTGMLYSSNEEVEITIWTGVSGQEKAKIRVDYNGARFQQNLTTSSDWIAHSNHFYLKAGVYTEGEDKEAKVEYSDFEMKY